MMKPNAVRGHGRVASVRGGVRLPRPTRYDRGDTTRGRTCVQEGEGEGRTLFTTAEAAAQLGISHGTVKTAIVLGTLPAERINPRLNMITAEAIAAYRRDHLGRRGRPKGAKNKNASTTPDDPSAAGKERDR
jgi:hypothetical protein